MVNFFINLLAALFGLIGFFSIIPFLIIFFLFLMSLYQPSQIERGTYWILLFFLGGTSSMGISIVYFVHRYDDLGRKLMIIYSVIILCLLLSLIVYGKVGERVLTSGNKMFLGILGCLFAFAAFFLFHSRVKQFFKSDIPSK